MKKLSAFVLIFVMVFCTISPLAAEEPKGNGSSLRYYTFEELTGFSKDDIEYQKPITREKFCEMIYNMIDKSMSLNWQRVSPNPFCDTDNEKVISLYLEGIIKGKGNRNFAPDDILSREEAATILMRAAGAIGIGFPENAYDTKVYSDEDLISDWAFASVHYARKNGIMEGTSETEFSPKES